MIFRSALQNVSCISIFELHMKRKTKTGEKRKRKTGERRKGERKGKENRGDELPDIGPELRERELLNSDARRRC